MASSVYHHFRPAVGGDGPAALDGVSDLATDVDDAPNPTGSTNARGSRSATPKNRAMGKGDESGKGRGSAKGPSADHNSAHSPMGVATGHQVRLVRLLTVGSVAARGTCRS